MAKTKVGYNEKAGDLFLVAGQLERATKSVNNQGNFTFGVKLTDGNETYFINYVDDKGSKFPSAREAATKALERFQSLDINEGSVVGYIVSEKTFTDNNGVEKTYLRHFGAGCWFPDKLVSAGMNKTQFAVAPYAVSQHGILVSTRLIDDVITPSDATKAKRAEAEAAGNKIYNEWINNVPADVLETLAATKAEGKKGFAIFQLKAVPKLDKTGQPILDKATDKAVMEVAVVSATPLTPVSIEDLKKRTKMEVGEYAPQPQAAAPQETKEAESIPTPEPTPEPAAAPVAAEDSTPAEADGGFVDEETDDDFDFDFSEDDFTDFE